MTPAIHQVSSWRVLTDPTLVLPGLVTFFNKPASTSPSPDHKPQLSHPGAHTLTPKSSTPNRGRQVPSWRVLTDPTLPHRSLGVIIEGVITPGGITSSRRCHHGGCARRHDDTRDPSRTTTPEGVFICDHSGLVINEFSLIRQVSSWRVLTDPTLPYRTAHRPPKVLNPKP